MASLSAVAPGCDLEMVIIIIALVASLGWKRRVDMRLAITILSVSLTDVIVCGRGLRGKAAL